MATSAEGLLRGRGREESAQAAAWGRNPVPVLLAAAVVASGTLLLVLGSKLIFFLDDWEFLLYRRGFTAHSILSPHGEHIAIGPILVYKALLATFGMGSALPFRVVSTAVFLLSAVLLFVYLRRRVGDWLALMATVVVLFLGAAWEDLLWPFQIGYFGSMAAGLGMLLALERGDRRGDRIACLLLTVATVFSSLGLPFAAGAAVQILPGRDRWRRIYVIAVPLALYAVWWLGWGHTADTAASLKNLATTPLFVLDGIAAALASLLGLATPVAGAAAGGLDWGRPLAVAAAVLVAWRLHRLGKAPRWFWITLAIGGAFWVLAGINQEPGREPTASRYQYLGVIFVLLVAAELLRGVRFGWRTLVAIAVVTGSAVLSNGHYLHQAYNSYKATSDLERADLGAVEIARGSVDPGFVLSENLADTVYVHVDAGSYLSAVDAFGSPAYTPAELAASPEPARFAADKVLGAALQLGLAPIEAPPISESAVRPAKASASGLVKVPADACLGISPGGTSPTLLSLPPAGAIVHAGAAGVKDVGLSRFAVGEVPADLGGLRPGETAALRIPADGSSVPWKMRIDAAGPTVVCGRGGRAG